MFKVLLMLLLGAILSADIKITTPIPVKCIQYTQFTACYSTDLNRAVYVTETLTKDSVTKAKLLKRHDMFHEDPILKTNIMSNFLHNVYDRGHMAASGNMFTNKAQYESFSMANMIPQYYSNNQGNWKDLETMEKELAVKYGKVQVINGTFGSNGKVKTSDIPKYVFKVLKNDSMERVYVIKNDGSQDINQTTLSELAQASGYKFNY